MRTAAMRQKQIHATRINWKISVSSARLNDFFDVLDDELSWRLIAPAAICTHSNFLEFRRVHWREIGNWNAAGRISVTFETGDGPLFLRRREYLAIARNAKATG